MDDDNTESLRGGSSSRICFASTDGFALSSFLPSFRVNFLESFYALTGD